MSSITGILRQVVYCVKKRVERLYLFFLTGLFTMAVEYEQCKGSFNTTSDFIHISKTPDVQNRAVILNTSPIVFISSPPIPAVRAAVGRL